jgi:asparagine synthase (glutamine-hydrolysing)
MCGIAGEIRWTQELLTLDWVQTACRRMSHRGPDGDGFYRDDHAALGHRRLSIIDLQTGGQPLVYRGRWWITFNGEIYNYRELRTELSGLGFEFTTQSDTEVILAAFAAWGTNSLERLNGIFAFGIWDALEQRLTLARDPLGVKPLLYHAGPDGVQFCSELKGLLCHPAVSSEIDPDALQDYLALGYVLAPHTILRGVQKLEPGYFLSVGLDGNVTCAGYWDPALPNTAAERFSSEREAVEEFAARFDRTTEMQMVSDVPLGAFLSGGIDSSAIVANAVTKNPLALNTFSIGFNEASFSELDYAGLAARHLKTDHHELVVEPQNLETLARLVWLYDEPLGDTSLIPTYFVSKLARERVTVALSGDGGDELLAGYDTYLADRYQALYRRVPGWLHNGLIRPGVNLLVPPSDKKVSFNFKVRQFIDQAYGSPQHAHYGWRMMFSPTERQALTAGAAGSAADGYDPFDSFSRHYRAVQDADWLTQSQYVDVKTWMVDDILVKVDRASMACSLESRVPFLAPDLVAFLMGLPPGLKLHGTQRKYLLKKAMRGRLPDEILYRKKRGFNAPISHWLRGPLGDEVESLFAGAGSGLIDLRHPEVRRLWTEHRAGVNDHGFKLWTLLSFLLWERQVLRGEGN